MSDENGALVPPGLMGPKSGVGGLRATVGPESQRLVGIASAES